MTHIENMNNIYGPPLTLQELCDNVFKYANEYYLTKRKLLGWGMRVDFNEAICNTHYAPHNGIINSQWTSSLPKGYPGWTGRIWIVYDKPIIASTNDNNLFSNLRLYTGSGGYGLYGIPFFSRNKQEIYPLSYDFRFYEADWPSLILGHVFGEENKESKLVYKFKEELYAEVK